jgi:hypothetical protein
VFGKELLHLAHALITAQINDKKGVLKLRK